MDQRPRTAAGSMPLTILALGMIGFILHTLQDVLLPLALAFFVSYLGMPVLRLTSRWGIPNRLAVVIVLLLFACLLTGMGYVIASGLERAEGVDEQYRETFSSLLQGLDELLSKAGMVTPSEGLSPFVAQLSEFISPGSVLGLVGTVAVAIGDILLVTIYLIFILSDRANRVLDRRMIHAFSTPGTEDAKQTLDEIHAGIEAYITLKTLVSIATGALTWLTLMIVGMPYAGLFGFLAFILNYIPTVGSITGALLPTLFAVLHFIDQPWLILVVGLVLGAIQVVVGNFVEPMIMGRRLGLNPITVLLGLVVWGFLWGIWGMVVSVPLMVAFRLVLEKTGKLPAVNALMSSE